MGRLMDSVMAALGLKPSDRVQISHGPIDTKNLPPPKPEEPTQTKTEASEYSTVTVKEVLQKETQNVLSKEIENKDCSGCRITAALLGIFGTGYIIRVVQQNYLKYPQGIKRTAYIMQGAFLASALLTFGFGRAFEIGLFDKSKTEYSLMEHLESDLNSLKNVASEITTDKERKS